MKHQTRNLSGDASSTTWNWYNLHVAVTDTITSIANLCKPHSFAIRVRYVCFFFFFFFFFCLPKYLVHSPNIIAVLPLASLVQSRTASDCVEPIAYIMYGEMILHNWKKCFPWKCIFMNLADLQTVTVMVAYTFDISPITRYGMKNRN